jgi:hypothetical protein
MATALVTSPFASLTDVEVAAWAAQALLEEAYQVSLFFWREGCRERVASLVEEAVAEAVTSGDKGLIARASIARLKVQFADHPKAGPEWLIRALEWCATEA